ncbi:unnamed protein product [Schistosoma mattheei]|uniref:Uncharacterized protein n=1 Tax=Schistosoma mattheei TaxID=31246 RepID=A0A3P7ZTW7_9TREM|nr:unnamed protein product [Schistosoma mattheei]
MIIYPESFQLTSLVFHRNQATWEENGRVSEAALRAILPAPKLLGTLKIVGFPSKTKWRSLKNEVIL